MKKLLYIITSMILISPNISFGFLSDSLDLDMYKKIDKWIYDLELKYYDRELRWWDMNQEISDNLNKTALINNLDWDCFKEWLTLKDVNTMTQIQEKIDLNWTIPKDDSQIQKIVDYIKIECIWDPECEEWKDCWYSIWKLKDFLAIASQTHQNSIEVWNQKLNDTFKIRRVWLYSDWIKENSSFDLMVDIQDINDIIFEKQDKYSWENNSNIWKLMESILSWKWIEEAINNSLYPENNFFTSVIDATETNPVVWWEKEDKSEENKNYLSSIWWNRWNTNKCLTDESWLDNNSINTLLKKINKDLLINKIKNWWNNSNDLWNNPEYTWWSKKWFKELWWNYESLKTDFWDYKKLNDNKKWPCNNFFCITTKFVIYNHKILWTTRDLSIEAILKRSNEHFKKFASTSLMQAKMATNNFEIWLRDINLPDMFHVWVQVTKKPVPLLWVDKQENDPDYDDFKSENMLVDYYDSMWLEYNRANDMENFIQATAETKTITDCEELSIEQCNNKISLKETKSYRDLEKWILIKEQRIDKKLLETDMKEFYDNFWEFETFTRQLMDYTFAVNAIVKEMVNIPINNE